MRRLENVPGWATGIMLGLATVLLRLPLLTPRLAHWDAVNYALGLHEFNIAAHQPHPPGSPYFILVGRAALGLVGDDNAALTLVSLVASIGAVLGEYALARLLFGPRAGFLAAVVLLTQPVFWGYGTMGMPWTLLACLAVLIGASCRLLVQGRRWLVLPSAVLLGVASGFRLDAAVLLGPLWLWSMWRTEPNAQRRIQAVGLLVVCVLMWLVPVLVGSGGPLLWSERLVALLPPTDAAPGTVARQLAANTVISFGTLVVTVGPAVVLSLACDWRAARDWLRALVRSELAIFWTLWIAPAFVFLWLVDSTEPGHALLFTVALCALSTGLLVASAPTRTRLVGCGTVLITIQVCVFLLASPQFDKPLAWTANSMLLNVTAPGLRLQQTSLDDALQTIRGQFDPRDTVVLSVTGQDAYRFMMYYLPDYLVVRLDPRAESVLAAREKHQGTWTQPSNCLVDGLFDPGVVRNAVWVLSSSSEPGLVPADAALVSRPNPGPFQVWQVRASPGTPDYLGFKLGGECTAA